MSLDREQSTPLLSPKFLKRYWREILILTVVLYALFGSSPITQLTHGQGDFRGTANLCLRIISAAGLFFGMKYLFGAKTLKFSELSFRKLPAVLLGFYSLSIAFSALSKGYIEYCGRSILSCEIYNYWSDTFSFVSIVLFHILAGIAIIIWIPYHLDRKQARLRKRE